MFEYQLNMAETVGFAIILLLLGRWIKKKYPDYTISIKVDMDI